MSEDPSTTQADDQPEQAAPSDRPHDTGLPTPTPEPGPHVAKAGTYYRNVRYVIFAAMIIGGLLFLKDGFISYPEEDRQNKFWQKQLEDAEAINDVDQAVVARENLKKYEPRGFNDSILPQRIIGFILIPAAGLLLYRWLKISRGEYRLDANDVLHAPGHPPVAASDIREINDERWARKGISEISYAGTDGADATITLDDFVYDAEEIHHIHDRLVHVTGKGEMDPDSRYTPGYVAPED